VDIATFFRGFANANGLLTIAWSATGAFHWQPGPGFVGAYDFVFLNIENGIPRKTTLEVVIFRSR